MYKLSAHCIRQYAIRTGVSTLTALSILPQEIAAARLIPLAEACQRFSLSHSLSGDTYREWYVDRIGENVLAIVRKDKAVVTILTERMLGYKKRLRPRLMVYEDKIYNEDSWSTRERVKCAAMSGAQ